MSEHSPGLDMVWCMYPDQDSAERAAHQVIDAGLAACASVLAPAMSVYRWQGTVEHSAETPLLCKTGTGRGAELAARLAADHPYALPAITWWAAASAPAVAAWAADT